MNRIRNYAALLALLSIALVAPAAQATDTFLKLCSPVGATDSGRTIISPVPGVANLVADVNGCISFDLTTDSNGKGYLMLSRIGFTPPEYMTMGWDGDLGTFANTAVKSMKAPCAGHFVSLSTVATLTGTCTTPPTLNVTDVTGTTTGTATVATTTVGTPVVAAQTLTFASGDSIGLAQTATPGTCTVPRFAVQATISCP